jgi:hypothetical protein
VVVCTLTEPLDGFQGLPGVGCGTPPKPIGQVEGEPQLNFHIADLGMQIQEAVRDNRIPRRLRVIHFAMENTTRLAAFDSHDSLKLFVQLNDIADSVTEL